LTTTTTTTTKRAVAWNYLVTSKTTSPIIPLVVRLQRQSFTSNTTTTDDVSSEQAHRMFQEQMKELQQEREALFGFTEQDHEAWKQASIGNDKDSTDNTDHQILLQEIKVARQELFAAQQQQLSDDDTETPSSPSPSGPFTHLSPSQTSVNMVPVGSKAMTERVAVAQSRVIFPTSVVQAFTLTTDGDDDDDQELVGPKGPIFATAKVAGIMAAKKTSDLIPLCHPLPLEHVKIDIDLIDRSVAVIRCECRVTHKTGVEMEAMVGASVTALTIYDMVKAVSHKVRIEDTILLSKVGGKRTIKEAR